MKLTTLVVTLLCVISMASVALAVSPPNIHTEIRTGDAAATDAALIVGIEDYAFLPDVPFALADAEAFRRFLIYTRGVPGHRVRILTDAPSAEEIRSGLEAAAADVSQGGTLWLFYSGHGAANSERQRVLVAADAKSSETSIDTRSVRLDELQTIAGNSAADHALLVIDACYAGVTRDGASLSEGTRRVVPGRAIEARQRVVVWSAASVDEVASSYDPARHGLFTYFVVGALRGWADGDLDGRRDKVLSFGEVQSYVAHAMATVAGDGQHPSTEFRPDLLAWTLHESGDLEQGPELADLPRIRIVSPDDVSIVDRLVLIEERQHEIQEQASRDWIVVEQSTRNGQSQGRYALDAFIRQYGEMTIRVENEEVPVDIPELTRAFDIQIKYDVYWKGRRHRQAGAGLLVSGGAVAAGGFVLMGVMYQQGLQNQGNIESWNAGKNTGMAIGFTGAGLGIAGVVNLIVAAQLNRSVQVSPGPVTMLMVRF